MKDSQSTTINQEACQWVARLHESELSEQERAELKAWINQSPEHSAEIRRMAKRWEELNALTVLAVPNEQPEPVTQSGMFGSGAFKAAVAAVFAFVVVGVLLWPNYTPEAVVEDSVKSYATTIGEQRLVTLPDNSTVLLNTNSQFNVAYTPEYRDIYLVYGEAHFEVAPNAEKPFRVFAGKSQVLAVGTAFSVYLKKATVEVTVTHGSVAIDSIGEPIVESLPEMKAEGVISSAIVSAGEFAEFNQFEGTIETNTLPEAALVPSWHHGQLKFSGEPLEHMVEEISRYSPLSIVILDDELRNLRIGGLFNVGETNKMFEALEDGFGIKAEYINENLVHLSAVPSDTNRL